jgi:hypothetical protein
VSEKFGPQMIERFLREHRLKFLIDQKGDFLVDFDNDNMRDYLVQPSVEGPGGHILCVRIETSRGSPQSANTTIEGFVPGRNRRRRRPKAYITDDVLIYLLVQWLSHHHSLARLPDKELSRPVSRGGNTCGEVQCRADYPEYRSSSRGPLWSES